MAHADLTDNACWIDTSFFSSSVNLDITVPISESGQK